MERTTVQSTNILSVGFDTENNTLEVEFKDHNIYQYFSVPEDLYDQLMNAHSKGRFLNERIVNRYRYQKIQ
jgi:KTSC domain